MNRRVFRVSYVALFSVCTAIGCSSSSGEAELGIVEGKVLVDGQPGTDLQVVFEPQIKEEGDKTSVKVGAGSIGLTDATGHYELKYQGAGTKGAVIGKHVVRITRMTGGGPAGGATAVASAPIPETYNSATTLSAEVATGKNPPKDFEIKTQ